jgi:hypothetical protein
MQFWIAMANPKQKIPLPRERPIFPAAQVIKGPTLAPESVAEAEPTGGRAARLTLIVWLIGFVFLSALALWDLVAALLFR